MRIHQLVITAIAVPLILTACSLRPAPDASEAAVFAPEMPPKDAGPAAGAPTEYGIGTVLVGNLTVNGETSVLTDTLVQKTERDGRTLDVYEQSAVYSDPTGPCDGQTHVLLDAKTQNWAGCMADDAILAESKPYTARLAWPLQVGNQWRATARFEDHVLRPHWSGTYWIDYEVLAYEEVTVPAGRYMAFKVGATKTQFNNWHETTWYSPEAGAIVKAAWGRKTNNGYGPFEGSWELVSAELR